ncbi:MAG: hypothetical protein ABI658_06700 [Acidimicrobiales bacterium]
MNDRETKPFAAVLLGAVDDELGVPLERDVDEVDDVEGGGAADPPAVVDWPKALLSPLSPHAVRNALAKSAPVAARPVRSTARRVASSNNGRSIGRSFRFATTMAERAGGDIVDCGAVSGPIAVQTRPRSSPNCREQCSGDGQLLGKKFVRKRQHDG